MNKTIGTCSLCGGAVTMPDIWGAIVPPIPTCSTCGATPKQSHGPVIEMERETDWRHAINAGDRVLKGNSRGRVRFAGVLGALSLALAGCGARDGCGRPPPDPEPAECQPGDKECQVKEPKPEDPKKIEERKAP